MSGHRSIIGAAMRDLPAVRNIVLHAHAQGLGSDRFTECLRLSHWMSIIETKSACF